MSEEVKVVKDVLVLEVPAFSASPYDALITVWSENVAETLTWYQAALEEADGHYHAVAEQAVRLLHRANAFKEVVDEITKFAAAHSAKNPAADA